MLQTRNMYTDVEDYAFSKLKTRHRDKTALEPKFVELKVGRKRQGKCFGAASEHGDFIDKKREIETSKEQENYFFISNDIWFHLANYIAPEDVKRYSLICSQSASSVHSRKFWLQMYRRYGQPLTGLSKKRNPQLAIKLRMLHLGDYDVNTLRQMVIQDLFCCYPPFKLRLETPYTLETLVGRTYVASWNTLVECIWLMCYKFKLVFPLSSAKKSHKSIKLENETDDVQNNLVDDWELLADEKKNNNIMKSRSTPNLDLDGIFIMIICSDRFIPFPSDLIYNSDAGSFRLSAGRELLSSDMRSKNLELDFVSSTGNQTITVNYLNIKQFQIIPWWHPKFCIFNKSD